MDSACQLLHHIVKELFPLTMGRIVSDVLNAPPQPPSPPLKS